MNTKNIVTTLSIALIAFMAGAYFGYSRSFDDPPPPPIETPRHSQLIASLRQDNQKLRSDIDVLRADNMRLNATNNQLTVQKIQPPPPVAPQIAPVALPVGQQQKAMLNNLRQISAARDQFYLENGRPPSSIEELVGATKYIRRLVPIDGENYTGISLLSEQAMTVTTSTGLSVTYDPLGKTTTQPEPTPEQARAADVARRLDPEVARRLESSSKIAVAAYKAANNGQMPPTPQALIPFFANTQEGADFVEYLELLKAPAR